MSDSNLLNKSNMESAIYLAFIQQRTQKEAVEFIHNKSYSDINIRTFKQARENLVQEGHLNSDGSLRNAKFESELTPVIEEIETRLANRNIELTEDEKKGLKTMMQSDWFKDLFQLDHLESLEDVNRIEDRLQTTNGALEVILQVIDNISYCGYLFGGKKFSDVKEYDSFEEYLNHQTESSENPGEMMEVIQEEIKKFIHPDKWSWKEYFWEKILLEDNCLKSLPQLDSAIIHYPSDIKEAKNYFNERGLV